MIQASVIIPVFNDQKGLSLCLRALRRQTMSQEGFEVIVVDNGSDPPIGLEDDGDSRLHVQLIRCSTPGSYAARNAGVAEASGRVLCFTDADCLPHENWLSAGVEAILAHPDQIIGGDVVVTEPDERTGTGLYQHLVGFRQQENIEGRGFAVTANLFCTRHTWQKTGCFNASLLSGGDQEWGLRAAKKGLRTRFESNAIVFTSPRVSLRAAIRQARRVAAGRKRLSGLSPDWIDTSKLHHRRSRLAVMRDILSSQDLTNFERLRIVFAATTIMFTTGIEHILLCLGRPAERR